MQFQPVQASGQALSVVTKTANYTAGTADQLVLGSTNPFTVTLYTAVGNSGNIVRVVKTDSSLTNIITLATTSSQTIGAGGPTSVTMNTQGEAWTVVSDGANWQVLAHDIPSAWVSWTPTFTGFGTAASISFVSRRVGDTLHVQGSFTTGTPTGVTAKVSIGFNGSDSNVTSDNSGKIGAVRNCGTFVDSDNGVTGVILCNANIQTISFGAVSSTQAGTNAIVANTTFGVTKTVYLNFEVPINGWNGF